MTPVQYRIASWCLAAAALFLVLQFGLVAALLAGLLVHELVHIAARKLRLAGATHRTGKLIALGIVTLIVGLLVTAAVFGVMAFVSGGPLSVAALMQKMADVVETARSQFPAWIQAYLPANAADVESAVSTWLREHAGELRRAGGNIGRTVAYAFAGMIIGGLLALSESRLDGARGPLTQAVRERARMFASAFRRVAFAQVRISALNTLFTGVYLAVILPLFGIHLPLTKTMIAVTFIAGLLPLLGNLISNTVVVIVSLSVSLYVAVASLAFLIVIHKLEYLLNARIIGSMIRARAWELLLAMLLMEALFGLAGVIVAPICYAYAKDELAARGAI